MITRGTKPSMIAVALLAALSSSVGGDPSVLFEPKPKPPPIPPPDPEGPNKGGDMWPASGVERYERMPVADSLPVRRAPPVKQPSPYDCKNCGKKNVRSMRGLCAKCLVEAGFELT